MKHAKYFEYYLKTIVGFQVPHSAMSFWETAVALACSTFSRSIHHWRGVLQKDHRKRAHHTTALWHVQIQRYMSYWETEKTKCIVDLGIRMDDVDDTRCPNVTHHALVWRIKLYQCQDVLRREIIKTNRQNFYKWSSLLRQKKTNF